MPSIRYEPEAYAGPGLPRARYRRRVKRHVSSADGAFTMAFSEISGTSASNLLTDREQEALEALADGLRSGEIARQLNTTVKTFYALCESLRGKLGARSEVHAVAIGFRRGLLATDRRRPSPVEGSDPVEPKKDAVSDQ